MIELLHYQADMTLRIIYFGNSYTATRKYRCSPLHSRRVQGNTLCERSSIARKKILIERLLVIIINARGYSGVEPKMRWNLELHNILASAFNFVCIVNSYLQVSGLSVIRQDSRINCSFQIVQEMCFLITSLSSASFIDQLRSVSANSCKVAKNGIVFTSSPRQIQVH